MSGRLLALALFAAAGAQSTDPTGALQRAHASAVRAERAERVLALWREALPERRAALAARIAAAGRERPPGRRPGPEELALWARVLAGDAPEDPEADALGRLADALDLQVVPGALAPRAPDASDARGARGARGAGGARAAPLVVHAYRSAPVAVQGDVTLALDWVAPDGARTRARQEPFGVGRLRAPGVILFVAPPEGPPALWRLEPSVAQAGRSARGVGVPVPVADSLTGGPALAALLERGVRPIGLGAQGVAGRGRAWDDGPFAASLAPWALVPHAAADEPGALVALLAPAGEASAALLEGARGAAWEELAQAGGHALVALELPAGTGEELARGLAAWRARAGGRPLVAVALGDAQLALGLACARAAPALDGLVLVGARVAPPAALASVPTLAVRCVPAETPPERSLARAGVEQVALAVPDPLFAEPELPAILAPWLERRVAGEGAR